MAELAQLARSIRGVSSRAVRTPTKQRYIAFLSYSHRDAEIADWLHESLEQYRVPARLVGQLTDHGAVPKRLVPIFRDRHELAASPDLGEEIEEALAASRFLIVLCSPAAAKSRWINEEIDCFKRFHSEDRVLACILDGEPFASEIPGREAEECFPEALRVEYDRHGKPTGERAEPVAADLREQGDGRRMALLKLAAGMLGVGLDDLAQREAQRRYRRMTYLTAASVAGMLVTSGLAYMAIDARDEARDQRREAEGLIGFMLGDLRAKLEPVGRLDVLDSVGARALAYYEGQDKRSLGDEALAQRSKALTLMGQIAASRGDLDGALRRYREALAGTAEALRRSPNDPQRMFDHAQSVFYVGETARLRGRIDEAAAQFAEYRRLADRMIASDPDNSNWRLEGVYASTNLGRVELEQHRYRQAAATFQASVDATEQLVAAEPANMERQKLLLEVLAYHSDALDRDGQPAPAIAQRQRQLQLLAPYLAQQRPDAFLRQKAMIAHRALSRMLFERGDISAALAHSAAAVTEGQRLIDLEPANAEWMIGGASAQLDSAHILLRAGRTDEAQSAADQGCQMINQLIARDRGIVFWLDAGRECQRLLAELALAKGDGGQALLLARQELEAARSGQRSATADPFSLAQAHKLVGDVLWRSGDRDGAVAEWRAGLAAWPKGIAETPRQTGERGEMLKGIGRRGEAAAIAARRAAMGYRRSLTDRAKI